MDISSGQVNRKLVWLGKPPKTEVFVKSKKGTQWEVAALTFFTKKANHTVQVEPAKAAWLQAILQRLHISKPSLLTLAQVKAHYEAAGFEDFELFWDNKPVNTLYKAGLLHL